MATVHCRVMTGCSAASTFYSLVRVYAMTNSIYMQHTIILISQRSLIPSLGHGRLYEGCCKHHSDMLWQSHKVYHSLDTIITYLGASFKLMFDHKILQARFVSWITDTNSNHREAFKMSKSVPITFKPMLPMCVYSNIIAEVENA
jgi:hypothetical protein